MKAAVLHKRGEKPRYGDFSDPHPQAGEVVLDVIAAAVENVDVAVAAGTHYATGDVMPELPAIPCFDGVGALPDGRVVGFGRPRPPYGALAERTVVPEGNVVPIPQGIEPAVVAAMSSAFTGMAMRSAADLRPGETVLIQGATGVAGRLAVKIARLLGAGRVVAVGRNADRLAEVNADAIITTAVDDDELINEYRKEHYDVVLDYLWGRPTELLLRALTPEGFRFVKPTRLVQIGEAAGTAEVRLRAESLRTSGLEIVGAAKGMADAMGDHYDHIVRWTRSGELTFDLDVVPLREIDTAWPQKESGRRLVVTP